MLEILEKFAKIIKNDTGKLLIKWIYLDGDDDLKSCGEEYSDLLKVPFEFIKEENEDDDDDY